MKIFDGRLRPAIGRRDGLDRLGQGNALPRQFPPRPKVAAALTVPLHVSGKPFGVLAVYASEPRDFSLDDVAFAESISHLLSASAARIKVEQKLQEVGELKSSLLGMVDSMVMTLDKDGRVVDMNRACEELTQYRIADVRDRPFWQAMVSPDDADLDKAHFPELPAAARFPAISKARSSPATALGDGSPGRSRCFPRGRCRAILVTGRDQTAQHEIKAELERVRSLTEETTATLNQLSARLERKRPAGAFR